jgi:cell fate regulator YaaT (PSP1 superfamily)
MSEAIGVRFKKVGKVYYFDPGDIAVPQGARVIVETSRGVECGEAVLPRRDIPEENLVKPLKKVIRLAGAADIAALEQNAKFEADAFKICEQKIAAHGLEMKLISVEYTFDHSKILFYFSAEGRVDFRDLVKDLAGVFRTRIELRQIGVRDEAKMIGGLGVCGCTLCCATFLDDFQPVSISMAKDQGLSLNPSKISGTCGRLMCCLKYENEAYQDLIARTPPLDSLVSTPQGRGTVVGVSLIRGTCKVRLQNNPDTPVVFARDDCKLLRAGRDKRREGGPDGAPTPEASIEAAPETPTGSPAARGPRPPRQNKPRENREGRENRENRPPRPAGSNAPAAAPKPRENRPPRRRPGGNRPGGAKTES